MYAHHDLPRFVREFLRKDTRLAGKRSAFIELYETIEKMAELEFTMSNSPPNSQTYQDAERAFTREYHKRSSLLSGLSNDHIPPEYLAEFITAVTDSFKAVRRESA